MCSSIVDGRLLQRHCSNDCGGDGLDHRSGLDGIARDLDPGDPNTDNLFALPLDEIERRGIAALPPTLLHAMDALVADESLRSTMGTGRDGDYVDYFAAVKRAEFRAVNDQVSPAEIDRYLTLM